MSMWDVWLCAAMLVSMAWCGAFDSPELAWLIVEESQAPPPPGQPVRRITPKSVFLAPSFTACAEGYREDAMGRCVKVVKVNQVAQWDFFLKKLNSMYGVPEPTQKKVTSGPVRLSIPLATEEPTTTTTPPPPDEFTTQSTSTPNYYSTTMSTNYNSGGNTGSTYPQTNTNTDFNPSNTEIGSYPPGTNPSFNPTGPSTGYGSTDTRTTVTYYSFDFPSSTTPPPTEGTTETPFVIVVPNTTHPEFTSTESTETSTQEPSTTTEPSTTETEAQSTETLTITTAITFPTPKPVNHPKREEYAEYIPIQNLPPALNKSKCSLAAQVSRLGESEDLSIDCEESQQEAVVVKRPSIRFPSETRKRPSYVRFPEVNRVWEGRPYWWPQSWNREQAPVRHWNHNVPSSYQKIEHFPSTWRNGNPSSWARGP